ncbi:MAG: hypothetical protein KKC26_01020 [Nanoarchaeota archaeon]|nr:hypothetical protein [Nanoarchaeota archaeon]
MDQNTFQIGNTELEQYIKRPEHHNVEKREQLIELLKKKDNFPLAEMEKEAIEQLKNTLVTKRYPLIHFDFLKSSIELENPEDELINIPRYSIFHKTNSMKMFSTKNKITSNLDLPNSIEYYIKSSTKAIESNHYNDILIFQTQFTGLIPTYTKEKIKDANILTQEIFLIAENNPLKKKSNTRYEIINKNIAVVGIRDKWAKEFYLIDVFNPVDTNMELKK